MPKNRGVLPHHIVTSPRFAPGSPARDRLFDLLSPEARDAFSGPVLPSAWIDERFAVELHRAVRVVLELRDDDAFKDYYRRATLVSYSRVYKFLVSLVSPSLLLSRAPSVWRRQHDTGEMIVDEVRDGFARGRIVGDPCATDVDYSLVLVAGIEAMMGITGVKPVRGDRAIRSQDVLELSLTWTPK